VPTLSYDLHLHPAPSAAPRWGDGMRVWAAAVAAEVRGFVWKAHEEHTTVRCRALPEEPVRVIASASLNQWAGFEDVVEAVHGGALWIWGPTQTSSGAIGWNLQLPAFWDGLSEWLVAYESPLVLATGHLGSQGRAAFAELAAANAGLTCSITHSLYVPLDEALELLDAGCVFEIDAYTYAFPPDGMDRPDVIDHVGTLLEANALVYFTSDGGQRSTGNPFVFGASVLGRLAQILGSDVADLIGVANPAALVARLERAQVAE
jgi:hypothetical protein